MPIVFTKGTVSTGPFGGRGGVSGDFNGDGLPDLAVTTLAGDQVNIYLARGDGTFQQPSALTKTGGQNLSLISFDGDKDGKADLLAADHANGGVYVFKGVGNGTFLSPSKLGTVGNAHSLGFADFDGNGYLDFVVSGYSSSQVTVGKLGANLSIVSAQTFSSGGAWARGIATGDFNKDGNTDFVVTNVNSNNAVIYYGPNFSTSLALSTGAYPVGAVSGDFNGDGRTDFVTSNYAGQSLSFFFNN